MKRYYSYPADADAYGADAFSKDWSHETFYAFLPFMILPKVLTKLENVNASCILVVPLFATRSWISRPLRILIKTPTLLPKSHFSLYFPFRRKKMPIRPNFITYLCSLGGVELETVT